MEVDSGVLSWFLGLVSFFTFLCLFIYLFWRFSVSFTLSQPGLSTGNRYFSSDTSSMSFNYQKLPLFFSYHSISCTYAFAQGPFCLPRSFACALYHPPPLRQAYFLNGAILFILQTYFKCHLLHRAFTAPPILLSPGKIKHSLLHPPHHQSITYILIVYTHIYVDIK